MAADPIDRITALLTDEAPEKRIAAAIVLGELRAKGPKVVQGLVDMLGSGGPPLQRHALDALTKTGSSGKALAHVLPLVGSRDADVRAAAVEAIVGAGDSVIPLVKRRMEDATPEERRALDAILARLGGKEAFTTLLAGLENADEEGARAAALAMRQQIRDADGRERRTYEAQIDKFLEKQAKSKEPNVPATAAAIKILGYLEDDRAVATLLKYAKSPKQAPAVRQEALIALRFALSRGNAASKVIDALVEAAEADDRTLAQTALITLGGLSLPAKTAQRVAKLAQHPDIERARFVIEQLGRQKGGETADVLIEVLERADRRRGELVCKALEGREDAVPAIAKALVDSDDADKAWMLRNVLRPMSAKVPPAGKKRILEAALQKIEKGERGAEALVDIARDVEPKKTAEGLRNLAAKLRKGKKPERAATVLRMLCRTDHATDEDRYQLASLDLLTSRKDTRPAARQGDDALRTLAQLLRRGYDVASALRKDRSVGLEELYYVGFHFVEEDHPLGEELLAEVAKKGGRAKIAKMAKNKLELAERSA